MTVFPPVGTFVYETFAGAILFPNKFRLKLLYNQLQHAREKL